MAYEEQDGYVGGEAKLYYNAGSYGSPDWTEIQNCGDVDVPDSRTAVAAPTRDQWPFVGHLNGSRVTGLAWTSNKNRGSSDTAIAAMVAAYDAGTVIEFAVADGDIATTGTNYRRIECIVNKADSSEPLDGAVTWSFEAKFALNASHLPARATA